MLWFLPFWAQAIIYPIIWVIGDIIQKIGEWFFRAYLTGALKTIIIFGTLILVIGGSCYVFVQWVNATLVQYINNMPGIGRMILTPIVAMLPEKTPELVTAIITYYTVSATLHVSVELAKLKAKWADKAMSSFKA